jgi:hypothetical protein
MSKITRGETNKKVEKYVSSPHGGCKMPNGQIGNFNLQQCVQIQTKSLYWNLREICLVYPFPTTTTI